MWSYSGRGLQSWGRERKHAGQSRMCSWFCRCGHGKEKENGGWRIVLQIPYQQTESGPCLVCYIPISARQSCPPGSLRQLLQDSSRNGTALLKDMSTCLVPLCGNVWVFGTWAIPAQLLPASGPRRRGKKRVRWFPSPFSHVLEQRGESDMARHFSTAWQTSQGRGISMGEKGRGPVCMKALKSREQSDFQSVQGCSKAGTPCYTSWNYEQ